jgi:superfamily II DNA/RNA helicase
VDGVDLVVHFDPPGEHKAYLHRSGRTARAGATGSVVTLVLPEQAAEVAQLRRRAGVRTDPTSADAHGTIPALPREHTARRRRHRPAHGRR